MTEAYKGELKEEQRKWDDLANQDEFTCPQCGEPARCLGTYCVCTECQYEDDAINFF